MDEKVLKLWAAIECNQKASDSEMFTLKGYPSLVCDVRCGGADRPGGVLL